MTDPRTIALDPRLDAVARYAVAIGAMLVLLLPAARGFNEHLGWLPMWLLAMPAAAWWSARGFPLPHRRREAEADGRRARARRSGPQARRRGRLPMRTLRSRAA